jgi:hypothetical protein
MMTDKRKKVSSSYSVVIGRKEVKAGYLRRL